MNVPRSSEELPTNNDYTFYFPFWLVLFSFLLFYFWFSPLTAANHSTPLNRTVVLRDRQPFNSICRA